MLKQLLELHFENCLQSYGSPKIVYFILLYFSHLCYTLDLEKRATKVLPLLNIFRTVARKQSPTHTHTHIPPHLTQPQRQLLRILEFIFAVEAIIVQSHPIVPWWNEWRLEWNTQCGQSTGWYSQRDPKAEILETKRHLNPSNPSSRLKQFLPALRAITDWAGLDQVTKP